MLEPVWPLMLLMAEDRDVLEVEGVRTLSRADSADSVRDLDVVDDLPVFESVACGSEKVDLSAG